MYVLYLKNDVYMYVVFIDVSNCVHVCMYTTLLLDKNEVSSQLQSDESCGEFCLCSSKPIVTKLFQSMRTLQKASVFNR